MKLIPCFVLTILCLLGSTLCQDTLFFMGGGNVPVLAHESSGALEFSGLELDCNDIADIPNEAYAPMGARTAGRPVVCGGQRNAFDQLSGCYVLNVTGNDWDVLAAMDRPRSAAAVVQLNENDFWLLGGNRNGLLSSTEYYVSATGQFAAGSDLPYAVEGHCVAKLNETHVIMSGGRTDVIDQVTRHVYIYDSATDAWTPLPDMNTTRSNHGCGVMQMEGGPTLVVGGGVDIFGDVLDTSEFFDINTMTWSEGPEMPGKIYGTTSIEFRGSFLFTGGYDDHDNSLNTMLEYDLNTLVWHKRHELMGTLGRGFHAAVVVNLSPEEAVCGNVV